MLVGDPSVAEAPSFRCLPVRGRASLVAPDLHRNTEPFSSGSRSRVADITEHRRRKEGTPIEDETWGKLESLAPAAGVEHLL